jgi:hypothetical protein
MSTLKSLPKKSKITTKNLATPQPTKCLFLVEMPKDIQATVSEILKRRGLVDQK